jgi:hypothetical protein
MGGYFKPMRRRFGVLTLGLACLLMLGWIRSQIYTDSLTIHSKPRTFWLDSDQFGIEFVISHTVAHPSMKYMDDNPVIWSSREHSQETLTSTPTMLEVVHLDPHFSFSGVHFGQYDFHSGSDINSLGTIIIIPYWVVIIPLTLLSAYLLLSNVLPLTFVSAWCLLSKPRTKPATKPESPHA